MKDITQQYIKSLLNYNPDTGIFTNRINRGKRAISGAITGCKNKDGYLKIKIDGKRYFSHRLAWLYMKGYFPPLEIDHIDRNPSNNKFSNLRESTRSLNVINTGIRLDNSSGIKGVHWCKIKKKWLASISRNKKRTYLGAHNNIQEALSARYEAEKNINTRYEEIHGNQHGNL